MLQILLFTLLGLIGHAQQPTHPTAGSQLTPAPVQATPLGTMNQTDWHSAHAEDEEQTRMDIVALSALGVVTVAMGLAVFCSFQRYGRRNHRRIPSISLQGEPPVQTAATNLDLPVASTQPELTPPLAP